MRNQSSEGLRIFQAKQLLCQSWTWTQAYLPEDPQGVESSLIASTGEWQVHTCVAGCAPLCPPLPWFPIFFFELWLRPGAPAHPAAHRVSTLLCTDRLSRALGLGQTEWTVQSQDLTDLGTTRSGKRTLWPRSLGDPAWTCHQSVTAEAQPPLWAGGVGLKVSARAAPSSTACHLM